MEDLSRHDWKIVDWDIRNKTYSLDISYVYTLLEELFK